MTPLRILALAAILALGLGGCSGLTEEQKARVAELAKKNENLGRELAAMYEKAKDGVVNPVELLATAQKLMDLMSENQKEIKKIQDEGATTGQTIAAVIGFFGRTIVHGATKLPLPGPLGMIVQMAATLLLGGSATTKKEEPAPAPAPVKTI